MTTEKTTKEITQDMIGSGFYPSSNRSSTGGGQIHYRGEILHYVQSCKTVVWRKLEEEKQKEGFLADTVSIEAAQSIHLSKPLLESAFVTQQETSTWFSKEPFSEQRTVDVVNEKGDNQVFAVLDPIDDHWGPVLDLFKDVFVVNDFFRDVEHIPSPAFYNAEELYMTGLANNVIRVKDIPVAFTGKDAIVMNFLDRKISQGMILTTRAVFVAAQDKSLGVKNWDVGSIRQAVVPVVGSDNFDMVVIEPRRDMTIDQEAEFDYNGLKFTPGTAYLSQYRIKDIHQDSATGNLVLNFEVAGSALRMNPVMQDAPEGAPMFIVPTLSALTITDLGLDDKPTPTKVDVFTTTGEPMQVDGQPKVHHLYGVQGHGYLAPLIREGVTVYFEV